MRTLKEKLVELHRRCGEEEEAYRLLCELVAADPEGEGLWEGLLNLLLSWRVIGKEGLDRVCGRRGQKLCACVFVCICVWYKPCFFCYSWKKA